MYVTSQNSNADAYTSNKICIVYPTMNVHHKTGSLYKVNGNRKFISVDYSIKKRYGTKILQNRNSPVSEN